VTDRSIAERASDAIAALRRSHDQLVGYVQRVDPQDLERQSGASEWTVAQVLSHLGSASEIGLNTLKAGKADLAAAPAVWDRWNSMSAAEQASGFIAAGERLVEALEALDEGELATKKIDVGFLPAPVDIAFVVAMRLSEVGLHGWDVEVVFDPMASVTNVVVPYVLDSLPMFAGFFAKPIGRSGRVAVETTDPTRHYRLELGDAGATLSEASVGDAETFIRLPAEAFLRLTSGRLSPDHTPASATAEGEISLDDLRRAFPGY
jgi:uncharacterized protein (TIGR03083 family)